MRVAEASAATREDAIRQAREELGVEMYEVDRIEIVDEGSKGLFGFGARPVKVKIYVEKPAEAKADTGGKGRGPRGGRDRKEDATPREARGRRGARKSRDDRQDDGAREARPESREEDATARAGSRDGGEREAREESGGRGSRRGGRRRGGRGRGSNGAGAQEKSRERAPRGEGRSDERSERAERKSEPLPESHDEEVTEPITDEQGAAAATLLQEVIDKMGIEASVSFVRTDDGSARLDVASEDSAILIGRKGRTLGAMQYLINRMAFQSDTAENTERLVVDVEGYVDRRRETLMDIARENAERAKETGRNQRLKPMSPQERRIIHVALQDDPDVRTFSAGEALYRSVVIAPKGGAEDRGRGDRGRNNRGGNRSRRGGRGRRRERPAEVDSDPGTFGD